MSSQAAVAGSARPPSAFTLLRRNFWLLFGGIFLLVGVVAMIVGAGLLWRESQFAAEAVEASGIVLGKSIDRATSDRGTEYFVTYRFTDAAGVTHDGRDQIDFDAWDALAEGGPISLQYMPDDPETNRMSREGWLIAGVTLGAGVLAAAVGTALTIPGLRGFRRDRRLWTAGTPAVATVTGHEQANVRMNGRYLWHVRYRYQDASGVEHEGRSNYLGEGEAHAVAVGAEATIRYDPKRPADSVWTGEVHAGPG